MLDLTLVDFINIKNTYNLSLVSPIPETCICPSRLFTFVGTRMNYQEMTLISEDNLLVWISEMSPLVHAVYPSSSYFSLWWVSKC